MVADVTFPIAPITRAVAAFHEKFSATALRLYIEGHRAVVQQVLERRCPVGIMAPLSLAPPLLTCERLLTVRMTLVVSPQHLLAAAGAPIPTTVLAEHIQLVHTDRSDLPPGREFVHLSPRRWLLAHLGAKLAFLRAGFGFGFMPLHVVEADPQAASSFRSPPRRHRPTATSSQCRPSTGPTVPRGRRGAGSSTTSNKETHSG